MLGVGVGLVVNHGTNLGVGAGVGVGPLINWDQEWEGFGCKSGVGVWLGCKLAYNLSCKLGRGGAGSSEVVTGCKLGVARLLLVVSWEWGGAGHKLGLGVGLVVSCEK